MEDIYKELSLEDCHTIIYNDLEETNAEVTSYNILPFSEKIEGLLGQHFKLEITFKIGTDLKTKQYFMKVLNGTSKVIFEMCMSINAYEKEDFFYNVLLKEFKKYKIDTNFAPQCYFSKPYLVVLEDMSLKNYSSSGSVDLNVNLCKKSLKTIAKLHSSSILYERARSEETGKPFTLFNVYPKLLRSCLFVNEKNFATDWLKKSVEAIMELIKIIPENHNTKEDFLKKFSQFVDRMHEIEGRFKNNTRTLLHGDLWYNNFLFNKDENVTDSVLLDFQIVKYGPATIDVMNFIFCNTRKKFRDLHTEELIDYYYECFKANLIKHQYYKIPTKEEYLVLSSDLKVLIKLLCLCDRTITLMVADETIVETDEGLRNYLLDERTANLIKSFNNDATFREVIEEDILELRDFLFEE